MGFAQIILLGVIQGITEFLPISSSGHLILAPAVFGFEDQGLALDAILHLASVLAIIIFFRNDLLTLLLALFNPRAAADRKLAWSIVLATFPAGIAGLLWGDFIEHQLRNATFVACNLIVWSLVFLAADRMAAKRKTQKDEARNMSLKQVVFVGFAQAMALLPGTSRSGVTIAAGLFCQLSQTAAARFSFLLGTPIILGAGLHKAVSFVHQPSEHLIYGGDIIATGFLVTFATGYYSIKLLLKIVARVGLLPFIVYRIALAIVILAFYSR